MRKLVREFITSRWTPWVIVGAILLAALFHEALGIAWGTEISRAGQAALWALGLAALTGAYLVFKRLNELGEARAHLETELKGSQGRVTEAYRRLEVIFQLSQKFAEAGDENEVIEPILGALVEMTRAQGAAFVPLDEHGQAQTALCHGELPPPVMETWTAYLASSAVRQRCGNCELKERVGAAPNCPLLKGPFGEAVELLCMPVRRGEREFGVASLFLGDSGGLDESTLTFVRALMDEAALGLEGVHMRRRELAALRQVQLLRQRTDLKTLLMGLLENVHRSLEADYAVMLAPASGAYQSKIDLTLGEINVQGRPFVEGLLSGVMASREPVSIGDVSGDPDSALELKSLMAAPLVSPEGNVLGAVLVGNRRARSYPARQMALLQTIAGQVALVVQNASLMAELEYQTMIQERARLAREIHDGLAQTIGFLKLQAAQLRNALGRGEIELASENMETFYAALSEAYQDARQAIDGLRISPAEMGWDSWLAQMASEFEEISGLHIELEESDVHISLPAEVQAQLVRILQEALSNVRKHAKASRVWIVCRETADALVIEVRDDGEGFSPEDVASAAQYGLRGMRERADLIAADFQVVSQPGAGATVHLRLPLKGLEEVMS